MLGQPGYCLISPVSSFCTRRPLRLGRHTNSMCSEDHQVVLFQSPFRTQLTYHSPLPGPDFEGRICRQPLNARLKSSPDENSGARSNVSNCNTMGLLDPMQLDRELSLRDEEREEMLNKIKALNEHSQNAKKALKREEAMKQHQLLIMKKTYETQLEIKSSLIKNLEDIIDEQEARIFNLDSRIAGLHSWSPPPDRPPAGVSRISAQVEALSEQNAKLQQDLRSANEATTEAARELEELRTQFAGANCGDDSSSGCSSDHEKATSDLETHFAVSSRYDAATLKAENDQMTVELRRLQETVHDQKCQMELLSIHYDEERLNTEKSLLLLKQNIFELKQENERLIGELDRCRAQAAETRNDDLQAMVEESPSAVKQVRELLKATEEETSCLKSSLSECLLNCKKQADELSTLREKMRDLCQTVKIESTKAAEFQRLSERLQENLCRLRRESTTWQERHADAIIALDCFRASLSAFREDQSELAQELYRLPAEFQKALIEARQQICRQVSLCMTDVVTKYKREMQLRKRLHNELIELRGNIRVFCRVRPILSSDSDQFSAVEFDGDDSILHVLNSGRRQTFLMDKVLADSYSQEEIFNNVQSLIVSVIDGFSVCIFAYGQTGSGKTYTMEGPADNPGINQRALSALFREASARSDWVFTISVSMLEIYNEMIRDLLSEDPSTFKLDVKINTDGSLHVPGLTTVEVTDVKQVYRIFNLGKENRSTATTNVNEHSSRSHALLCVSVVGYNTATKTRTMGKLNLVDLAGSERLSKTAAVGERLKEAQAINKSLAALGDVICALRNKQQYIPFRNSKLTYLLQGSLAGDSKTLMLVHVAPNVSHASESLCSLNFAQRVRSIELGVSTQRITQGNASSLDVQAENTRGISPLTRTPSKQGNQRSATARSTPTTSANRK